MKGSSFMQGCGMPAAIALILTALGLMPGIGKPADAVNRIGAILGVSIVLLLIPVVLVCALLGLFMKQSCSSKCSEMW